MFTWLGSSVFTAVRQNKIINLLFIMSLSLIISLLSVMYLTSLPIIAIITNVYPHLPGDANNSKESEATNRTYNENKDEGLMLGVLVNQSIIFIIGGLGNFLTLLAIPYVRLKYGMKFSVLQLNSVVLILHLSLADLMYSLIGFPNFLMVYFIRDGLKEDSLCYYVGIFRNLVAYVDFNTIAMIACCVAKHNLCSTCGGASLSHDKHDKIFGGKQVYLVCILIWVVSFLTILPDVMGVTGTYAWSYSPYGCDISCPNEGCLNIGPFLSIINNIVFMIIFYFVIIINLHIQRRQVYGTDISNYIKMIKSISTTLAILIIAYLVCLLPVIAFTWGYWPAKTENSSYETKAIFASIYWWLYGVNFFIYLATSSRIREAYRQFMQDMWKMMFSKSGGHPNDNCTDTSAFWISLRHLERKNVPGDVREK